MSRGSKLAEANMVSTTTAVKAMRPGPGRMVAIWPSFTSATSTARKEDIEHGPGADHVDQPIEAGTAAQAPPKTEARADHEIQETGELEQRNGDARQENDQRHEVLLDCARLHHAVPHRAFAVGPAKCMRRIG